MKTPEVVLPTSSSLKFSPSLGEIIDERVFAGVAARARTSTTLETFKRQGERCGWCAHPIRLIGSAASVDVSTGEVVRSYSTNEESDGVLLKACGTRRATRCASCATTYASDARMLVRAGMSGGKGIPETVSQHPMVFATFTAPSFGAVHTRGSRGRQSCHPGNNGLRCPHGRRLTCWSRHRDSDSLLGDPLCFDCYDYERSILWNATCPELWRRTTIYVRRELAARLGMSVKQFDSEVRLSFAKVAEYQRRGAVHLHAVIRLDARDNDCVAPLEVLATDVLTSAIRTAASKVSAPVPRGLSGRSLGLARWGTQLEVRTISIGESVPDPAGLATPSRSSRAIANYIAKYATKSTDDRGALDQRLSSLHDLDIRGVEGHLRRMVETAWKLGALPHLVRVRAWAHSLGFGGHWLTKSRHYSVTLGYLRKRRQTWQIEKADGPRIQQSITISLGRWKWIGTGWRTVGDEWLASLEREARKLSRVYARESLCIERRDDEVRNRTSDLTDGRVRKLVDFVEPIVGEL